MLAEVRARLAAGERVVDVVRFTAETAERTCKSERAVQRDAERSREVNSESATSPCLPPRGCYVSGSIDLSHSTDSPDVTSRGICRSHPIGTD